MWSSPRRRRRRQSRRRSRSPDAVSPQVKPTKAAITVTPGAVQRPRALFKGPTPQLIRIGVRNKGCAGLSYHLQYVDKPGKFDEVELDGVKGLIDSKALFSIIGSEMDWHEDAPSLRSRTRTSRTRAGAESRSVSGHERRPPSLRQHSDRKLHLLMKHTYLVRFVVLLCAHSAATFRVEGLCAS